MQTHIVISALGKDRPGIVKTLSKELSSCGANITESRMMVMGGEFSLMMLLQGDESITACITSKVTELESSMELTILCKPTSARSQSEALPYQVTVVSMDHPGIVHDVSDFFSSRNLNIEEIETTTYHAAHTGTPMFSLEMTVSIPASTRRNVLKDAFYDFCDEHNLDGNISSQKK